MLFIAIPVLLGSWAAASAIHLSRIFPRNVTLPIGNISLPIGNISLPIGNVSLPIGNISLPIGNVSLPSGNITLPGGNITLPIENITLPSGTASVTPHVQYSSSIGVLGCKINVNRVAYWPAIPSCDNLCVKVTANGRSVNLLRIDQSGGAWDISYDAWNYLVTGESAAADPTMGGGITAQWEDVPVSECADVIDPTGETGGKLALSAANSMDFLYSCIATSTSASTWVGRNYVLYNIADPVCKYGFDETCTLPPPDQGNQATCPHSLGLETPLISQPVWDIAFGTGLRQLAQ